MLILQNTKYHLENKLKTSTNSVQIYLFITTYAVTHMAEVSKFKHITNILHIMAHIMTHSPIT